MPDLTPITREEMFLDGNTELTPITREEKILAGEDIDVITRREWFLKKYRGGGGGGGYQIKDIPNTPCDIATFTDGANLPMPSLKTTIVPIQSGSGDPSPSNIRPISGWSGANVSVCGVNLFNVATKVSGYISNATGALVPNENAYSSDWIPVKGNTEYYIKTNPNLSADWGAWYDKDKNFITGVTGYKNRTKTSPPNAFYARFTVGDGNQPNDFSVNYPSTDTSYHAYNGHTTTIPFTDAQGNPVTVYGGECDVVNGGGSACKEYDSYNGETLIGPWISDRDVYAPNTSPTIGAQVVDMGDTSNFNSQPTSIKSLEGENNVWGDCGQILEGEYFSKEA